MSNPKLTDSEIVKALPKMLNGGHGCKNCKYDDGKGDDRCGLKGCKIARYALDLINRLQAQNKDLAETVHNLTIEKDALFDKAEELKAEIERLKTNLNVELENFATEYDNKIKAEAIKEFAEKLKNEIINDTAYACDITQHRGYYDYQIKIGDIPEYIDNLVKEMVGENNEI